MQQPSYLTVNEPPLFVLARTKSGKTHLGYHWVYYNPIAKLLLFEYRLSRSRAGPNDVLKKSRPLQCDGFIGKDDLLARARVLGVGCFAHAMCLPTQFNHCVFSAA